jgi:hypothetical protein
MPTIRMKQTVETKIYFPIEGGGPPVQTDAVGERIICLSSVENRPERGVAEFQTIWRLPEGAELEVDAEVSAELVGHGYAEAI